MYGVKAENTPAKTIRQRQRPEAGARCGCRTYHLLFQGEQRIQRASSRSRIHSASSTLLRPQAEENRMPNAIACTLSVEEAVSGIATLLARGYQRHLHEATSQSIKTNDESFEDGLAMQPDQSVHASGGRRNTLPSAVGEYKQGVDA